MQKIKNSELLYVNFKNMFKNNEANFSKIVINKKWTYIHTYFNNYM